MRLIENSAARNIFDSLKESEEFPLNKDDEGFNETVLRDFRLFLMDKYGDELYQDVTDEDVNEYFTGMFYDIWDNDDFDTANAAEDIIRAEYHVPDKSDYYDDYEYDDGDTNWAAEEEADALERFENRYMGGGNGASFNESSKFLNEASDSSIDSIVNDVLSGNEVYVRLDEKDYSSEEGSNIYKIEYSYSIERPEDYDNGYNSGWDRGQDEEFDKKQDERFEKATKAYEEGEVFEFNCVKIEDGKIQYTGFCLLKCFGIEELRHNLEYYKAKRIGVKTISSFEDLTEGVNKFTESANDRYQVREFDGPGAKFGVYDTKQKKFIQKGSKKVMIASCDELNKKAKLTERVKVKESVKPLNEGGIYPVEIDEEANQALANKLAEILGCDSGEDISVDGLELIPAKGFGGGGHYWFRAQVNIGQAGSYHEDFIWKALEAVKDQCPHLYKIYENGTQSGPGSIVTGETSGLEVNYYSTIDIIDDEDVRNGLSFEYSDEDLELAGCDLKTLEAEETPVGDYLCSLVKEHMSELIELLKSYEISEDDSKYELNETARYATNIDWETDGDDEVKKELPKKVEIPQDVTEDTVADWLSDKYGWLVNSVSITEKANDTVDKKPNYVIFYLNGKELGGHDLKNEFEGERESAKELFAYENGVKPEDIEERLEYRESMNESVKSKKSVKKQPKENKRVIMQQGNVTCFKENDNTYYVFENENDNEVEHDSEESAMHDFLERVGIDANAELKEK